MFTLGDAGTQLFSKGLDLGVLVAKDKLNLVQAPPQPTTAQQAALFSQPRGSTSGEILPGVSNVALIAIAVVLVVVLVK